MADRLLSDVIQLENQIQQQLQAEQVRADAWLERVRQEQAALVRRSERELGEKTRQALIEAEQAAAQRTEEIESRASDSCQQLESIGDEILTEVLGRQLGKILPGQGDDHQDVQS